MRRQATPPRPPTMTSPSKRLPLRLRSTRGRLCCLIALPGRDWAAAGFVRELALVASPTAPYLRRLGRHRRSGAPGVTPPSDPRQISFLPPDAAALLHLVRENLRLLADLATRYEVARLQSPAAGRTIRNPADAAAYLGAELA